MKLASKLGLASALVALPSLGLAQDAVPGVDASSDTAATPVRTTPSGSVRAIDRGRWSMPPSAGYRKSGL